MEAVMMEWNNMAMEWLSDYAPMGVFVVDTDLKIRFWNRWMAHHTGKSAEFVAGKPLFSICPEIESRGNAVCYEEALSGKSAILAQRLHGYLIPMPGDCAQDLFECMQQTAQIAPVKKEDQVAGIVTFIEDVTERIERDLKLSASERRYRTLFENARDAVFVIQAERVETANPAARRQYGLSGDPHEKADDFRRFRNAVDPDFIDRLDQRFQDRMAGKPMDALFTYPIEIK